MSDQLGALLIVAYLLAGIVGVLYAWHRYRGESDRS